MLLVHVLDSNLTTRVFSVGMEHFNMIFFFFFGSDPLVKHHTAI
jgi:hypothetical protein